MGRRPPALGGASVSIPMQPVQVINAPGTFATWACGGLLQVHQPKAFRDGPSRDGHCMGTSKQEDGVRSHAPGWLTNRICGKPSCPTAPCLHCLGFLSCDMTAREKEEEGTKTKHRSKGR